jgi:hypothetical protein
MTVKSLNRSEFQSPFLSQPTFESFQSKRFIIANIINAMTYM